MFNDKDVSVENRKRLWEHYFEKFSSGIDLGYNPSIEFFDQDLVNNLKNSIAKYSAFKETAFRKDLESLLTDNGRFVPKAEFKKEAYKISGDYNDVWLDTEYHQTVANANMAQKWKEFEANVDLYPNLKLISVNDGRVRPEHKVLDGTIRPFDDPFWDEHTPPLDWGCRCGIEQTDEDVTEVAGGIQTKIEFANNPGKSGEIFGKSSYEEKLSKSEKEEALSNLNTWTDKA